MRARTSTPDDAKRVTMQVSTVGIVCNAALTVFKLVAGIVAHSSAIVADAVHSASDILGSLIVMIGAVFSHKAADASVNRNARLTPQSPKPSMTLSLEVADSRVGRKQKKIQAAGGGR